MQGCEGGRTKGEDERRGFRHHWGWLGRRALESEKLRTMKDVLLGAGKLWECLREKAVVAAQPKER
jgi:hypothetical protein